MLVKICFKSEVWVEGENIEDIKSKWEEAPIFCVDALDDLSADIVGVDYAMDENGKDYTNEIKS